MKSGYVFVGQEVLLIKVYRVNRIEGCALGANNLGSDPSSLSQTSLSSALTAAKLFPRR